MDCSLLVEEDECFFPLDIKHIRLARSYYISCLITQDWEIGFYGIFISKSGLVTGLKMQKFPVILPFWQTCPKATVNPKDSICMAVCVYGAAN